MASADGRLSRSVEGGSDVIYEFACSPCEKDGKHVEALNACVECGQNLCLECLRHHDKFESMRGHTILDKGEMTARGPQLSPVVLKEKCSVHGTEIINMYCGNHDVVCCAVCIALTHRLCQDVDYILNAAKGMTSSSEVKDVEDGLKKTTLDISNAQKNKLEDLKIIEQEKNKTLSNIDDFRDELVKHLDDMVKKAKDEVHEQHAEITKAINTSVARLSAMSASLDKNAKHVKSSKSSNAVQMFLHVKQGKSKTSDGRKLLQELDSEREQIIYILNNSIKDNFMNVKSIGKIHAVEEKPSVHVTDIRPIKSAILHKEINVKVKGDENTCCISGSCLMDNGSLVVSDDGNKKLKLLNSAFQVVDSCTMPCPPWGVCSTGPTEVAVALIFDKKIQFVSTGNNKLSLTKSFQVGACCYYVAFSNRELFVICGDQEQVRVYSLTGQHLRTFKNDTSGQPMFSNTRGIVASNDGTNIHVTDWNKGVITVDRQGHRQSTFTDPSLKGAWGVSVLENNNLLVSGCESHSVIQIGSDGRMIDSILSTADGIAAPYSLCYDKVNSRLIVTMSDNDRIKVFDLTRK